MIDSLDATETAQRLARAATRVAFAGTPEFARAALQAIVAAGFEVPLVLTQPDRPAGRGLNLQASAVKRLAQEAGLPLVQPPGLRLNGKFAEAAQAAHADLLKAAPDVLVVAAYGLILPEWLLGLPRWGCLNIHGSLLPRWRGAAPIQRAIEAGDVLTGITLMQMDAGLDTGAMLLTEATAIGANDTAASLHDRLAEIGARLIVQGLEDARRGCLVPTAQPSSGVSYAHKIDKAEAAVDWQSDAGAIERRLRAFDPFPGCTSTLDGQPIKLWRGRVFEGLAPVAPAGQRLALGAGRIVTACGQGALEWLQLQLPGSRRMSAEEYLQRHPAPAVR